jgi:hypothetical protein
MAYGNLLERGFQLRQGFFERAVVLRPSFFGRADL